MLPKNASLTRESLVKWSKKAIEYRRSEVLDEAGMSRGFEIAGKEPLAFIEVADLSNKLSQKTAEDFSGFPMVMAKRYNVFMAPGSRIDVSKENDPMSRLRAQVDLYYQKGVRNFYFSVLLHGTKDAIVMGNKKIPPSAFSEMFREYSDCRFTMNAVSCYGGGLADEMEQFVDYPGAQEGRVSVFMQTKEDVINYAAVTGDDYSTLYNAALSVYLMQGIDNRSGKKLTYGEAHLLADRYAKIHGFNDAEVFCSRPDRKSAFVRAKKYS